MTNKWKQNLKLLKSLFYKAKLYNKIIAFPHATEGLEMIVITIYCFNVSYHMFQFKDDPSRSFNCSMFCFEFENLSNILWTKNLIQLTLIVTINLKMTLNVLTVNNARKSETEMKMEFFEKSLFRGSYKSGKISQFSAAPHQLPNMRPQFYLKELLKLVLNASIYWDHKEHL